MSVAIVSLSLMKKTRQPLPEGLAEIPPGPELAAVLATIDPRRLGSLDCVEVMRAQQRQVSHEQARPRVEQPGGVGQGDLGELAPRGPSSCLPGGDPPGPMWGFTATAPAAAPVRVRVTFPGSLLIKGCGLMMRKFVASLRS